MRYAWKWQGKNKWFIWNGSAWVNDTEHQVREWAYRFCRREGMRPVASTRKVRALLFLARLQVPATDAEVHVSKPPIYLGLFLDA
jgi:hypothetical protein